MFSDNESPNYWVSNYPSTVMAMARASRIPAPVMAEQFALIAGDHLDMPDADVIETWAAEWLSQ